MPLLNSSHEKGSKVFIWAIFLAFPFSGWTDGEVYSLGVTREGCPLHFGINQGNAFSSRQFIFVSPEHRDTLLLSTTWTGPALTTVPAGFGAVSFVVASCLTCVTSAFSCLTSILRSVKAVCSCANFCSISSTAFSHVSDSWRTLFSPWELEISVNSLQISKFPDSGSALGDDTSLLT